MNERTKTLFGGGAQIPKKPNLDSSIMLFIFAFQFLLRRRT